MKTVEIIGWLVASTCLWAANLVSAYNYFFGGK